MQATDTLQRQSQLVIPPQVRGRTKRRRFFLLIAALVTVALGLVVFLVRPFEAASSPYQTAPVEVRTITRVVEAAGHLDVVKRANVPAPIAGQLVQIQVRSGDEVEAGQVLARLDQRAASIEAQAARARGAAAESRVAEAQAALSSAADALERTQRLRERELASEREVIAARAAERKARAAVSAARAERAATAQSFKAAELARAGTVVTSPIAGIVLQAPDTIGTAVSPEQGPLFVVGSSPRELRIQADVAESEIGSVQPEQAAQLRVPAFPDRTFPARVVHTDPEAVRTGLAVRYPVELSVQNPERLLLPGMTATVSIEVAHAEQVLATREAALRFHAPGAEMAASRSRVWRLVGSALEPVAVEPGISDGAYTALVPKIPGSLTPGMQVAIGLLQTGSTEPTDPEGPGIRLGKR